MGIPHVTYWLAALPHATHLQRPASYRGIYLNDTLAKLYEGLLLARLTTHTVLDNTLTYNQLGTTPCTQTHDAICSLFSTIQYNKYTLQKPAYVAFVDYSTAYPSVQRDRLSSNGSILSKTAIFPKKEEGNVRFSTNLQGFRRSARPTSMRAPKAHRMMGKTQ